MNEEYNKIIKNLKDLPYKEYLKTEHWIHFRSQCLDVYNECAICSSDDNLIIHHKSYENKGRETFKDIVVICDYCHEKIHLNNTDKIEKINLLDIKKYEKAYFVLKCIYVDADELYNQIVNHLCKKNKKWDTPYNRENIKKNLRNYINCSEFLFENKFLGDNLEGLLEILNNISYYSKAIHGTTKLSHLLRVRFEEDRPFINKIIEHYNIDADTDMKFPSELEERAIFLSIPFKDEFDSISDGMHEFTIKIIKMKNKRLNFQNIVSKLIDYYEWHKKNNIGVQF